VQPEIERELSREAQWSEGFSPVRLWWRSLALLAPIILGITLHIASCISESVAGAAACYGSALLIYGLAVGVVRGVLALPPLADAWERLTLSVPIVGTVRQARALRRYFRVLARLNESGLEPHMAMAAAAPAAAERSMVQRLERAAQEVEAGAHLAAAMARTGFVPPQVVQHLKLMADYQALDKGLTWAVEEYDRRYAVARDAMEQYTSLAIGALVLAVLGVTLLVAFVAARLGIPTWLQGLL
jgi:type II secretory pathway component PulF